ncbi:MAG TPA: SET domain-containing protein-lysine N-methyltransferase [Agriterribacter sp.]|nr:SET domain-containing protein-lysine N-methyltransferase [Agriterribacter sp.]
MLCEHLYIENTKDKGRGVFTSKKIDGDTIIEISPVIVMSAEARKLLDQTLLHDYIFVWGEKKDQCCMALGYIAVYNHACPSNCEYFMDYDDSTMFIKTVRAINAGEELTINYNGSWNNKEKVWFEVKK